MLEALEKIDNNPRFRIKDMEGKSTWRKQRTGIRQGCPLSPYLFVIFMTILFHDVEQEVGKEVIERTMDLVDFSNILYADDTFLVGKHSRELNKILHAIEKHSLRYGMKLNKNKCVYINMNCNNQIKFQDGTHMPNETEATYLGAQITKKNQNKKEVDERICKALATCNKLKLFLKKAKCSKKWKLQVYNAVVISQLVYGLETL